MRVYFFAFCDRYERTENGVNLYGIYGEWRGRWQAPWSWLRPQYDLPLPVGAIWPGFLVNTVFYATLLWLLIRGPFVLRRFIRHRRGQCPQCAYPMGETVVCSECGEGSATMAT